MIKVAEKQKSEVFAQSMAAAQFGGWGAKKNTKM